MLIFYRKYFVPFFLFVLLSANTAISQTPTIQTLVDSNEILIGGQFHLKISASYVANAFVIKWFSIPDSLPHFDVIETTRPDSISTYNGFTTFSQTITLTSFDSGKWSLPVFRINFHRLKDNANIVLYSDSFPVTVSFSVADTSAILKDIKPGYDVSVEYAAWYWIAAGLILLLGIGLSVWAYRYWKKKPSALSPISKIAAYEQALMALEALNQYQLSSPEQVKIYHTQLVDILKKYLSAVASSNHLNKSTSDLIMLFNKYALQNEAVTKAAASLRCSDAVKFAKYHPLAEDSIASKLAVQKIIVLLNKTIIAAGNSINNQQ